jgi:hypothetical protein
MGYNPLLIAVELKPLLYAESETRDLYRSGIGRLSKTRRHRRLRWLCAAEPSPSSPAGNVNRRKIV